MLTRRCAGTLDPTAENFLTQLRGADVIEREGLHGIRITPEAGTVKNNKSRVVPIHEYLIEQGFLEFVKEARQRPNVLQSCEGRWCR